MPYPLPVTFTERTESMRIILPFAAVSLAFATCGGAWAAFSDQAPSATQSDTEKSRAAVTDFATLLNVDHEPGQAFHKYFSPHLVQHDPWIGDGNGGDEAFLAKRRKDAPGKYDAVEQYVNVVHNIMADGDLVAIKSHVFTSPTDAGRVFVDIWRMDGGQFVEHWDIIQPIDPKLPDAGFSCGKGLTYEAAKAAGNTVANPACGKPDESADRAANRQLVLDYMHLGLQPGKLAEAINTYLADDFVQHSPNIPDGKQGALDYLASRIKAREKYHRTSTFQRVLADGDLVMVHRLVTSDSNPRGTAYIDLYRVKHGKIAEHWDVVQPTPEFSVSGRSMTGGPDSPLEPGRYHGQPPAGQGH